ncbi:tRNA1Val (adenine37-N6)-methyltransferase [bacterium A37T11]|nr:tRNA1Val (adenine37-N6)-methyltransferase [bacterium A37T11]
MSSSIFRFKRFKIDQSGSAMKVNTDGVLLGAIAGNKIMDHVLEIGTGTGLVSLMLAQRFEGANIQAVEIDEDAARQAKKNFTQSPFAARLDSIHTDFKNYEPKVGYDLIVSNPPYFINSLKNSNARKAIARHSSATFYDDLLQYAIKWLNPLGKLALIMPITIRENLAEKLSGYNNLNIQEELFIRSFPTTKPIRVLVHIIKGTPSAPVMTTDFTIYQNRNEPSEAYQELLKDFFLAF